jgi:hypothetical protein
MGRREKVEELSRIKAEATQEIAAVNESGGNVQFLFDYHKYLNDLKTVEDQPAVAAAGKKFRRRPVQLAAVATMKDLATMSKWEEMASSDLTEDMIERLETAARSAYAIAAGHFEKDSLASLPEPGPEAMARRQKAMADWDRLVKTDLESLVSLALFGHEINRARSMSTLELVKGVGSLILLAALAVGAYYVWSSG